MQKSIQLWLNSITLQEHFSVYPFYFQMANIILPRSVYLFLAHAHSTGRMARA